MKLRNVILLVTLSLVSVVSMATDMGTSEKEPKRVFQISYLKEVEEFKISLNRSLEKLRLELTEKKYPQAYFIRSIQSQVAEMNFRSANDFKNLEEQLFSLLQSVNSQSNANKSLAHLRYDGETLYLPRLSQLKKQFQSENEIIPTYVYNAPDSDSHTTWQKIQGTVKEFSSRDETLIFFTVLAAYLFLVARRKIGKVTPKTVVKNKKPTSTKIISKLAPASAQIDLTTMEGVAICRVNARDQIVYMNPQFVTLFGKQKVWRTFFNSNFFKDKRVRGATNLYQLQGESDSRFLVQATDKETTGVKTIFLWDLSWSTGTDTQLVNTVAATEISFHDLIEDALVKFQSFSKRLKIIGADELKISAESLEDVALLKMTENYIKIIYQVANFKNATEEIILKVDETEKRCLMSAFIPGVQLQPTDLSQKITLGNGKNEAKTLNSVFKAMKTDHGVLSVEFKIKNVFNSKSSGLYLDLSFNKEIDVLPTTKTEARSLAV